MRMMQHQGLLGIKGRL
uniref:Uncharacterized protein n=1 Tax=Arundo donax TaxID=35708 RepID=A0A0A9E275_ARUDO